jgi:hypothetical protein
MNDRNDAYKSLVIGRGEVGRAIANIFRCIAIDVGEVYGGQVTHMHICFGWTDKFEEEVKRFQDKYKPLFTIIHSTVPVGTSARLGAMHSPVRGMHPNLEQGIRTFQKFLGGVDATWVAEYFRDFGLRVVLTDKSETTELGMLLGTEHYRMCIEFAKDAKKLCDAWGVPFEVSYTLFSLTYNDGWQRLGLPEYVRPVLQPIMTTIGGHCLESNHKLIQKGKP